MQSLGFVETQGYVPAFAVADAMVKAANVEIVKKVWIGAVRAAIDAAEAEVERIGKVVNTNVIARPDEALSALY